MNDFEDRSRALSDAYYEDLRTEEPVIHRWSVAPKTEPSPGRLIKDRYRLAAGGESLRWPPEDK